MLWRALLGFPWWAWLLLGVPAALLTVDLVAARRGEGLVQTRQAALALAEPNDAFAATTLVAECAPALVAVGLQAIGATIERVRYAAVASGFDRLAAKLRV